MLFKPENEQTLALDIVRKAGEALVAIRSKGTLYIKEKGQFDLVTEADFASHEIISQALTRAFPDDAFLSEEGKKINPLEGRCWIADPLDGTANFIHGQDHVAVSLALYIDGVAEVGVVHAPFRKETFWAVRGQGAFRDDTPLKITKIRPEKRTLIATGFPHDRRHASSMIDRLYPILTEFGDIRCLASPALDICWVADGRLDGFLDRLMIWDVAAAGLIASEAGAKTTRLSDAPLFPEPVDGWDYVVAPSPLFEKLCAVTQQQYAVNEQKN